MRVYISGVFDLFHYGHMRLLNNCKRQFPNDILIVGVHNDEDCEEYKRKPILSHEERVETIKESGLADIVFCNAPLNETKEFYIENNIDLVIHAHKLEDDEFYRNKFYKYASENGMFERLDYTETISTSDLIKRIQTYS